MVAKLTVRETPKKRYIMIECFPEERELLVKGAKISSLQLSTFCRTVALKEARKLKQEDSSQNA